MRSPGGARRDQTPTMDRAAPHPGEFRRDGAWRVVLAGGVGCAFGLTALPFYTIGIFAAPLAAEFGWSRGTIQSAIAAIMLGVLASAWFTGRLVDRIGVRRVALGGQAGLALGFLALAAQTGNPLLWHLNWFLLAVLGVGTTPLTWSRGVASWFERSRGMAIGLALTGTGATALAAPPLLTAFIAAYGWRAGYAAIALGIVTVAMPAVWLLFRERTTPGGETPPVEQSGVTLREALAGRRFWLIVAAFAMITFAVAGIIPNLVPMLTDGGLSPAAAARYASLLGLAVIAGRLGAGWLLDRFWAPAVGLALLVPPAVACLLLAARTWPLLSILLIGLAGGAEFDLIAYLCLRYFGLRHYGRIYAWQWTAFSLASGVGPLGFALIRDATGSYDAALLAAAAMIVAGPLLLLALGRYPAFPAAR